MFEDTCRDGCFRVKDPRGIDGVAAFGIGCAVHDAFYLRPSDGSCAHGTGFNRDVEGCVREVFASERLCGGGNGLYLRVGGDVGKGLGEIISPSDDLVLADDDAAYGNFVGSERFLCFAEGEAHEAFIVSRGKVLRVFRVIKDFKE